MEKPDTITPGLPLRDEHGVQAEIIAVDRAGTEEVAVVRLFDGLQLAFPVSLLQMGPDGAVFEGSLHALSEASSSTSPGEADKRVPVIEEQLHVGKQSVDTGRGVRISKRVEEREETVDLPLLRDELVVERIARDVLLDEGQAPVMREEGDTIIVPVLEEVLLVQKRLRLKEEIRITRRLLESRDPQAHVLRTEHVSVERFDDPSKTGRNR